MAMPKAGTKEYEDLAKETGGGSTLPGFDYEGHIAATSGSNKEGVKSGGMPKVGTKEYEDLAKETGGGSTLPGFDYKAHIAATSKREFLSDGIDSLTGQANFDKALMGGDDFLEVTGGVNNFANGNKGADHIVLRGGLGKYLGGADNDKIEVFSSGVGSWVNGNRGIDTITGSVDGVTYRGGADNDILAVSAGTVWGDKGADTFQAIGGAGVAIVQDYTAGEDLLKRIAGGSFTLTEQGLSYGVGGDKMLLLAGITNASQVTLI